MAKRYVYLLAGLMLASLALSVSAPAQALPSSGVPLPGEFMGLVARDPYYDFNTNPAYPNQPNYAFQDAMGARLADLGVRWVRIEYKMRPGQLNLAAYDYFINTVAPRHNLKVLLVLGFDLNGGDPFALENSSVFSDPRFGGGVNQAMQEWLTNALLIAEQFRERVHAYELLNEQNRLPPSGGAIDAQYAARLHIKFYRLLKLDGANGERDKDCAGVPQGQCWRDNVKVILGGLHTYGTTEYVNGVEQYTSDVAYLRQLYTYFYNEFYRLYTNANGQHYYPLDGIGYHPYPEEIKNSANRPVASDIDLIMLRLDRVRARLCNLGTVTINNTPVTLPNDCQQPFWVTEVGWNVDFYKVRNDPQVLQKQSDFLYEVYRRLARRGDTANLFWFKYEDFPPAERSCNSTGCVDAQKWGLLRIPFTPGNDAVCPGGACYEVNGNPSLIRPAYRSYQILSGRIVMDNFLVLPRVTR